MSKGYPLKTVRGDSFQFGVVYKTDGQVVNLSGYTAQMVIAWAQASYNGVEPVITGNLVIDGVITPASGKIDFTLTPTQTTNIPKNINAFYAVRLTSPGGIKLTLVSGDFTVEKNFFEVS